MATKYGVIACEDAEKWGGVDYVGQLTIDVFREDQSEDWTYFRTTLGELPDAEELCKYKGFIIGGSHYSANDTAPWVDKLEQFIRDIRQLQLNTQTAPKLVGICFGHQIMNKALGAKVIKNKAGKFVFGRCDINIDSTELKESDYYKHVFHGEDSFVLLQSHSEEVTDLPPDAKVLASSETCPNEIVSYGDKCLSFQGHMEITDEQALHKILPAIKNAGLFSEQDEQVMWENMKKKPGQRDEAVRMINKYFK